MKINCSIKKNFNKEICKKQVGEGIFSIIIPKADNSRNKIKHSEHKKLMKQIHKNFGGSTTKPTTLGCYSDKGKLQCETGFKVMGFRDFDTPYDDGSLKKKNSQERIKRLKEDYSFMKKIAKKFAILYGQDSIPVIYDNVNDISYIKGKWQESIPKKKVYDKKMPKDPFLEYI